MTDVPSMLINRDNTPRSQEFIDIISKNKTFRWRYGSPDIQNESDLLAYHVRATLIIPQGWNESLENGDPKPCCFIWMGVTSTQRMLYKAVFDRAWAIFS
jgi:hypothetical protein